MFVLAAAAAGVFAAVAGFRTSSPSPPRLAVEPLAASPAPALIVPKPGALRTGEVARWATVLVPGPVRSRPDSGAPAIGRLELRTPERTSNVVAVLARRQDDRGQLWVQVRLPALPQNVDGWVPRAALGGYNVVRTRLVVDLDGLEATLFSGRRPIFRAPIGVGAPNWSTPEGEFYIRNKLTTYQSPFYGPIAFGTSARSSVLTDWPGGGFIGIHGTNRPDLLPGRVSHGCIRMRNSDIRELSRLMPVGTPVTIA